VLAVNIRIAVAKPSSLFYNGYNVQQTLAGVAESGLYGQPFTYQLGRTLRFTLQYNF
jgi:hypothetical protein